MNQEHSLTFGNQKNVTENKAKLLGVNIDIKLNFDSYVSELCKKASNQLHAISRLQTYLGFEEKTVLIQSFFYANFNYCSLIWHFTTSTSKQKI